MAAGRPTKFKAEFVERAATRCAEGATDDDLAQEFGVCRATIKTWKAEHPEFLAAIKEWKADADDRIEQSLYGKARGGDVTACIFWLKNRRPKDWRDKHDLEHTGAVTVQIISLADADPMP